MHISSSLHGDSPRRIEREVQSPGNHKTPDQMKRYQHYAEEIAELIRPRALRPGDRLPSVRQASASRRISPSTVFEAYYLLEARGLIRSRPRSGYYVNARPAMQQA